MQGKLLGFMVTVSVFAIFSGGAEAQHVLKRNARHVKWTPVLGPAVKV